MADPKPFLDFNIHLAQNAANLQSAGVETIELRCEEGEVIKIGRHNKSDISVPSPGVSWAHAEMRIIRDEDDDGLRLVLRDISSNGTGIQIPGQSLERITKGEDTYVPHGTMVALPMKLKKAEDQRFLQVLLPDSDTGSFAAPAVTPAAASNVKADHGEADDNAPASPAAEKAPPAAADADSKAADTEKAARVVAIESDSEPPARADSAEKRRGQPSEDDDNVENMTASEMNSEVNAQADARKVSNGENRARASSSDPEKLSDDDEPAHKRQRKTLPMPRAPQPANGDDARAQADRLRAMDSPGDVPPAMPPSGPPGARQPPRGARAKGMAGPARAVNSPDVPAPLREKILVGEANIREAREAEDRNQWGQAFDCYQRGLGHFMEVLPQLAKDSVGGQSLRQQINGYLTRAGELKAKLEISRAYGCRKLARPRGPPSAH